MKRIILILLILIFIIPATGRDKCKIFASPPGGYTLPGSDQNSEYIMYFNKEGILNEAHIMKSIPVKNPPDGNDKGKKNRTWIYIALGAIAAAVIFALIKCMTITALALAVLLLITAYIGYKKKWKHYYVYLIAACLLFVVTGILTDNQTIMKGLFLGAMAVILILSLIVDRQHKKIKKTMTPPALQRLSLKQTNET